MKKTFSFISFIFLAFLLQGQTFKDGTKVPESIVKKFTNMFPNITNENWGNSFLTVDSITYAYYASFKVYDELFTFVSFDSTGNKIRLSVDLPYDSLPSKIDDYLRKKYKRHITSTSYYKLDRKKRGYYHYVTYHEQMISTSGVKVFYLTMSHHKKIKRLNTDYRFKFDSEGNFIARWRTFFF